MKRLLLGNEAIALGAYWGGVRVASGYPGTPSSEILGAFARYPGVYAEWAPNEKVALDAAIGACYAGSRALVTMKHVGVNVAADALFAVSYTGVNAGLVLISADDPGSFSSQTEQDNRNYAKFVKIPMLEAADSQGTFEMMQVAYDISERFDTPVMFRTTTRTAHSRSVVDVPEGERTEVWPGLQSFPRDMAKYVMLPANARARRVVVEDRLRRLEEYAETFPFNRIERGSQKLGIISSGAAYGHARDVFPNASFLHLGLVWPLPRKLILDFAAMVDQVVVIEELDPFLEEHVRLLGVECMGKRIFPVMDELTPTLVRRKVADSGLLEALGAEQPVSYSTVELPMVGRPPVLCPGCGHRGVFQVLKKLKLVVSGDIGCYALGALPPLSAMHTTTCMGGSIGMAHGITKAGTRDKVVATIGDSTFFHAGLPALANVVYNQGNTCTIILDNSTTAMTGHQDHPGSGVALQGQDTSRIDIAAVCRALGVQHVEAVEAYDMKAVEKAVRAALAVEGPSVLVVHSPCIFVEDVDVGSLVVDEDRCNDCGLCYKVGCPPILRLPGEGTKMFKGQEVPDAKAWIDPLVCLGCTICEQACHRGAIHGQVSIIGKKN